jgi:DNA topoisomerase-3
MSVSGRTVIKEKTAYGCSQYQHGCDFRYPFDVLREKAKGTPLTAALVFELLNQSYPTKT